MKKVLFFVIGFMLVVTAVQAQTLSFGPEIGINFNRFTTRESAYKSSFKPGFRAGMNLNLPVTRRGFIGTGVFFNQKGHTRVYNEAGTVNKDFLNINYFQVPVNYVHRFKLNNAGSVMLIGGVYVGYGIGGKERKYQFDSDGKSTEIMNSTISMGHGGNQYNPFDLGVNAGVVYEIPFGLYFKALYAQGVMPVTNNHLNDKYQQSIQFCLGLNFWTWLN